MKTLIVTRHAKSSWNDPLLGDHARPLNDRGNESATAMGLWLKRQGYLPDAVLSSTAERCVQTWERIGKAMESIAEITYETALYHSSAEQLLKHVQSSTANTLMVLAHNPGIGDFAERLAMQNPDHEAFWRYPTCATTVLGFDVANWMEIGFGMGQVEEFKVPKDL